MNYEVFSPFNEEHGMDLGVIRLLFADTDLTEISEVLWKEHDSTEFLPAKADGKLSLAPLSPHIVLPIKSLCGYSGLCGSAPVNLSSAGYSRQHTGTGAVSQAVQFRRRSMVPILTNIWDRAEEGPDTHDFPNLDAVAERLLDFQYYWANTARPFEWKFTRRDLDELLVNLSTPR